MDQAHARALVALQPFLLIATTTKSPSHRFLADNISRATSAPGTFVFTELLQTPAVQSLRSADTPAEYRSWLTLLEIFSYGTYQEYQDTPNLPPLNESQATKLRQLTLLSLAASPTTPLTYANLLKALSLPNAASLESLVTTSIYSSLLTARLCPTSNPPSVHVTSVAPLRDLRPMSLPSLLKVLSTWSSRCDSVITELESQMTAIKTSASARQALQKRRQDIIDAAVKESPSIQPRSDMFDVAGGGGGGGGGVSRNLRSHPGKGGMKRDLDEQQEGEENVQFEDAEDASSGPGDDLASGKMEIDPDLASLRASGAGNGSSTTPVAVPGGAAGHSGGGGGATRGNKKSKGKLHS